MNTKLHEILVAFDGKLVGSKVMKLNVCEVISKMPKNIISFITKKCWFFASMEDAWAFTFTGNDLKGKHLIFLSDDLMYQEKSQIQYTIAHEIGHVILNHRNSVLEKQTKNEIKQQETEADAFAKKYL